MALCSWFPNVDRPVTATDLGLSAIYLVRDLNHGMDFLPRMASWIVLISTFNVCFPSLLIRLTRWVWIKYYLQHALMILSPFVFHILFWRSYMLFLIYLMNTVFGMHYDVVIQWTSVLSGLSSLVIAYSTICYYDKVRQCLLSLPFPCFGQEYMTCFTVYDADSNNYKTFCYKNQDNNICLDPYSNNNRTCGRCKSYGAASASGNQEKSCCATKCTQCNACTSCKQNLCVCKISCNKSCRCNASSCACRNDCKCSRVTCSCKQPSGGCTCRRKVKKCSCANCCPTTPSIAQLSQEKERVCTVDDCGRMMCSVQSRDQDQSQPNTTYNSCGMTGNPNTMLPNQSTASMMADRGNACVAPGQKKRVCWTDAAGFKLCETEYSNNQANTKCGTPSLLRESPSQSPRHTDYYPMPCRTFFSCGLPLLPSSYPVIGHTDLPPNTWPSNSDDNIQVYLNNVCSQCQNPNCACQPRCNTDQCVSCDPPTCDLPIADVPRTKASSKKRNSHKSTRGRPRKRKC